MTDDDVSEEDTSDEDTDLALGHVADGVEGLAVADLAEHVVPVGLGLSQLGMADVGLAGRQQHHRVLLEDGSGRCHCAPLHGVLQLVLQLARLGHQLRCRAAETGHAVHQLGLEEGGTFIDCFQQALV